jgi:hypothetical protein
LLAMYQSYCLVKAVQEPVGARLDAPVPLAMWNRIVLGVWSLTISGLPPTPPDIDVLDGRELGPSDVLGRPHHPL